jgi:hypothetical protein
MESRSDVYKVIFIAGNEPFTQGPVNYADACKAAINKGIIVNTIHCGTEAEGINTKWKDGATIADGKYLVIDHNRAVVTIEAPQDKEIARLGEESEQDVTWLLVRRERRVLSARKARMPTRPRSHPLPGRWCNAPSPRLGQLPELVVGPG